MPRRVTQDGQVIMKSLTKHAPLEEGMQTTAVYSCRENPVNVWKSLKLSVQWHLVTKLSVEGGPTNVDMIL